MDDIISETQNLAKLTIMSRKHNAIETLLNTLLHKSLESITLMRLQEGTRRGS